MSLPRRNGSPNPPGSPAYDRLFVDGLLTCAFAVGFDEYGANRPTDKNVERGLLDRGFVADTDAVYDRLAAAERPLPQRRRQDHYIAKGVTRDDAGQPVDAIVSLVRAGDGSAGGDDTSAFLEGLERCEVAVYGGHGRYGTGPDFDYNFIADLVDDDGHVTASYSEYRDLNALLSERGQASGRSALVEYRDLLRRGRLVIHRINGGNLVVNLRNYHAGELGAHVMVDQLQADANVRRMSQQRLTAKYRLWMFQGCRTNDYFYNLRTLSPQANAGGLDLIGTRRVVYWSAISATMLGLLDGLFAREDYPRLLTRLSATNPGIADTDTGPSQVADLAVRPLPPL